MRRSLTATIVATTLTLAACDGGAPPQAAPSPTANTVTDYTTIINTTKPKFEEAADDDLCIIDIIMKPDSDEASDCITLAGDIVNSMTRIKTRFEELGPTDAPDEISILVVNTQHMAISFLEDENFAVRAACEDRASDECATAVGGVIKVADELILPQMEEWEPHLH